MKISESFQKLVETYTCRTAWSPHKPPLLPFKESRLKINVPQFSDGPTRKYGSFNVVVMNGPIPVVTASSGPAWSGHVSSLSSPPQTMRDSPRLSELSETKQHGNCEDLGDSGRI
jgi:hypothetical protein